MDNNNNNKKLRWRFFIDKPFQIKFILKFSGLIFFSMLISFCYIAVNYYGKYNKPLYFRAKDLKNVEITPKTPVHEVIDLSGLNAFQVYLKPIVYLSIFYIVMIIIFGLFISHSLAGPVYRIKRILDEASKQDVIDITNLEFKLRKNDELQDLAESLNNFLEALRKKDIKIK